MFDIIPLAAISFLVSTLKRISHSSTLFNCWYILLLQETTIKRSVQLFQGRSILALYWLAILMCTVGQLFVRLDHHSAIGDIDAIQRYPCVFRRVACHTSPEARVVPPATIAIRGTVEREIIVVLIVRRKFHSVVHIATKQSVAVVLALILSEWASHWTIILFTSSTSQSLSPSSSSLNY